MLNHSSNETVYSAGRYCCIFFNIQEFVGSRTVEITV